MWTIFRVSAVLAVTCSSAAVAATAPVRLVMEPGLESYPPQALAQHVEADVLIAIDVSADGQMRCMADINAPALLRRSSCLLVAERDVLGPAIIDNQAQSTHYQFVVRWSEHATTQQFGGAIPIGRAFWVRYGDLPTVAKQLAMYGRVSVSFKINDRGRVDECEPGRNNTASAAGFGVCNLLKSRAAFLPALDAAHRPTGSRGWFNASFQWCKDPTGVACPNPDTGR